MNDLDFFKEAEEITYTYTLAWNDLLNRLNEVTYRYQCMESKIWWSDEEKPQRDRRYVNQSRDELRESFNDLHALIRINSDRRLGTDVTSDVMQEYRNEWMGLNNMCHLLMEEISYLASRVDMFNNICYAKRGLGWALAGIFLSLIATLAGNTRGIVWDLESPQKKRIRTKGLQLIEKQLSAFESGQTSQHIELENTAAKLHEAIKELLVKLSVPPKNSETSPASPKVQVDMTGLGSVIKEMTTLLESHANIVRKEQINHSIQLSQDDRVLLNTLASKFAPAGRETKESSQQPSGKGEANSPTFTRQDYTQIVRLLENLDQSVKAVKKAVDDKKLEVISPKQIGIFNKATSP